MDLGVAGYSVTAPLYTDVNMYVCTYTLGPFYLLLFIIFFCICWSTEARTLAFDSRYMKVRHCLIEVEHVHTN